MPCEPPATEEALWRRADALAGRTLGWLAAREGLRPPLSLRRDKGWAGQLLERALGATAGSRALPDFPHLGVELKSIPLDHRGRPRESTYVCVAPLDGSMATRWAASWVARKLARVLWVPIIGAGPPAERLIGAPLMWSPSPEEARLLRADWEALSELIHLGLYHLIDARKGRVLQLRPKAASGSSRVWAQDAEGEWVRVNPRGFYLRAGFTRELLARHFRLPG